MDYNEDNVRASYLLWLRIKILRNTIEDVGNIVDVENEDDNFSDILERVIERVEELFYCIGYGNTVNVIRCLNNKLNSDIQNQVWNKYELLIEHLLKILMSKDYNVIQDFHIFMDNINNILLFFENELRKEII